MAIYDHTPASDDWTEDDVINYLTGEVRISADRAKCEYDQAKATGRLPTTLEYLVGGFPRPSTAR